MVESLARFSDELADAAARAAEATVLVDARARIPASGIVWSPGVIVTANHVVERDTAITVGSPADEEVEAQLAGRDPGSDIAVLRIDNSELPPATFAPADAARVGHFALALGRPAPGGHMASGGVVTTLGGAWRTFRGSTVLGYLRADVTMFPGFSGGPLIDVEGRVIGMNSSALGRGGGLTIPVSAATPIVDAILARGHVARGYLGISTQRVRLSQAVVESLDDGQDSGLLISGVESGSPADQGGLFVGDILIGFNDHAIASTDDLQVQLGPERVNQKASLRVVRGGQVALVEVTVGERG